MVLRLYSFRRGSRARMWCMMMVRNSSGSGREPGHVITLKTSPVLTGQANNTDRAPIAMTPAATALAVKATFKRTLLLCGERVTVTELLQLLPELHDVSSFYKSIPGANRQRAKSHLLSEKR